MKTSLDTKLIYRIGMDLQAEALRMLKLSGTPSRAKIEEMLTFPLPAGVIQEGRIDRPDVIVQGMRALLPEDPLVPCVLGLPFSSLLQHKTKLPLNLTEAEKEAEIMTNVSRYFPSVRAKLAIEYFSFHSAYADHETVVIFAVLEERVATYLQIMKEARLSLHCLDVDVFAALRVLTWQQYFAIHDAHVFVDIHVNQVKFIVYDAGKILMEQTWSFDNLKIQLQRSLTLLTTHHCELHLKEIFIRGEWPLEADWIQSQFALTPRLLNPFQHFDLKHPDMQQSLHQGHYTQALGFALRGFQDDQS